MMVVKMPRNEIAKLAKYGEDCLHDSDKKPELKDKLLSLAEEQFNHLIKEFNSNSVEPMVGYLYCRLGDVKYSQKQYDKAEKSYLDALVRLTVRGEYCQDRAHSHIGLARTYMKLGNRENAKEHFIRGIHLYDSLAMKNEIDQISKELKGLRIDIKDILPAKQINEKGEPTKCRECGGFEFKKVALEYEKIAIYDCVQCGCRNVILLDMLELMASPN